jgi:hypothetical protein
MTASDGGEAKQRSRWGDIRPAELLTAISVIGSALGLYTTVVSEVTTIKQAQSAQVTVNRELRQEIREVAVEIKTDIREMRQEMRARRAM